MRSPLGGSIATCLIFVPLVAVPLLAVVGTPQLSARSPNSTADDLKFAKDESAQALAGGELLDPVRVSDSASDAGAAKREPRSGARDSDPFAEFTRDADNQRRTPASSSESSARRSQRWPNEGNGLPQKALLSSERQGDDRAAAAPSDRPAANGSLDGASAEQQGGAASGKAPVARRTLPEAEAVVTKEIDSAVTPPATVTAETRTVADSRLASNHAVAWKRAVGRLNALGIRDYQLQPGEHDGEFNFSCRFAARSNPRVIHRFEAEAADPLEAVNQVLRQLDDWRARHSDRRQASREATSDNGPPSKAADASPVEVTNRDF
jgi:hypothetical protein